MGNIPRFCAEPGGRHQHIHGIPGKRLGKRIALRQRSLTKHLYHTLADGNNIHDLILIPIFQL